MRWLAVLLLVSVAAGADPVRPIRLPEIQAEPTPLPVTMIGANQLYVIDSDVQLIAVTVPTGVLSVTMDSGPLRIKAEFADDPGSYQTRTYSGKWVYCLEAAATGSCELLLIPVGIKSESEIIRRQLTAQIGPRPPPDPKPDPKPPEPVKAARLQVIVVEDVLNRSVETATVLNATAMWQEFAAKDHEWRFYDSTTAETNGKRYVGEIDKTKLPQLLIRDRDKDAKLTAVPLPKDTAGVRSIVSQFSK